LPDAVNPGTDRQKQEQSDADGRKEESVPDKVFRREISRTYPHKGEVQKEDW